MVDVAVINNTPYALKRVYFHGVVHTPGRSLPWAEDTFNYSPAGGIEPGESAQWDLLPNQFTSEFAKVPRDRNDIVFDVTVRKYETADGQTVDVEGATEQITALRRQIAAIEAQMPTDANDQPSVGPEPVSEPDKPTLEYRLWSDTTGRFEVMASLIELANGVAKLQKEDLSIINVPLDKLSDEDKAWIRANFETSDP